MQWLLMITAKIPRREPADAPVLSAVSSEKLTFAMTCELKLTDAPTAETLLHSIRNSVYSSAMAGGVKKDSHLRKP
jgi:hypothetical protein